MAAFIGENIGFSFLVLILGRVYRLIWNVRVFKSQGSIKFGIIPKISVNPIKGIKLWYSKAFKSLV